MAKRVNYGFAKRQKELKQQQKKEAKAEKKRMKKESAVEAGPHDVVEEGDGDLGPVDDLPSGSDPRRDDGG